MFEIAARSVGTPLRSMAMEVTASKARVERVEECMFVQGPVETRR